RLAFLRAGHYRFLADAVVDLVAPAPTDGCVLDVGGGTGYYLATVLDALPASRGIVLDVSRHAARRAVRVPPRVDGVVAGAERPAPGPGAADAGDPRAARAVHRDGVLSGRQLPATRLTASGGATFPERVRAWLCSGLAFCGIATHYRYRPLSNPESRRRPSL